MSHDARARLRLLLVTDGKTIPNWLFKCIQELEQSSAAHVALVLQAAHARERGSLGFVERLRQFSFSLYKHVDRLLFRRLPDALTPIDLQSALPDCGELDGADLPGPALGHRLQEERIDVVLDPFSLTPEGYLADLIRYGVWSTTFGEIGDPRTQSTPAFWEVVEGRPSTETRLCVRWRGCDQRLSLHVSVAPTDRRSVSRSQNHIYWKMSAALVRMMQMLSEDPDAVRERLKAAAPFEVTTKPAQGPGNLEMLRAGISLVRRYASDKWARTFYREQWALAYRHGNGDSLEMETFQKLLPPRDRFWADPFPIQVGNDYYLFHEELLFSTGKGSIVLTVVGNGARPARPIPILAKDYHLSYPFVFQWDGDLFMMPETASRRHVELYRCVHFPADWKLERILLPGVTARDPTAALVFGTWWLFATIPAYAAAAATDELHVFSADSPLGPWTPHRHNPIKSDVRSARPAGRIFEHQGQFYRPAQDCSERYGYGVSINRILELSPDTYKEVEVDKIVPRPGSNLAGVHIYNRAGDMTVIDCLVRSRKF